VKVVIMAGGKGSRLSEETVAKPKPMVEIGDRPILWHIMMHYAHFDFRDFIVALGYKGEVIKKYMVDYCSLSSDLKVNLRTGTVEMSGGTRPDWNVELIETGLNTGTGGRLRRLAPLLGGETCMMTWGDGVSDVDLGKLLEFHRAHGKLVTMTAVRPPARYGHLELEGDQITEFSEKPQTREGWINGAFFVVEPGALEYIRDDETMWEQEPLRNLARDGQLMAYRHSSFWQCMDTLREKHLLETMWESGKAPWKIWE
jgi:glucose-1-phosphate cytidylyltransferase